MTHTPPNILKDWTHTAFVDVTALANQLQQATNTAHQIKAQMDDLEEKRRIAEMSAAVAHASLDTLIEHIQNEPQSRFYSAATKDAIIQAREACDPAQWDRLLDQFQTMQRALAEIARSATNTRAQLIAQGALDDIS